MTTNRSFAAAVRAVRRVCRRLGAPSVTFDPTPAQAVAFERLSAQLEQLSKEIKKVRIK